MLGQLVAARLAIELILGGIHRLGFFEDLARELLVVDVGVAARVARQLRAVDGDHPDAGEAVLGAERQQGGAGNHNRLRCDIRLGGCGHRRTLQNCRPAEQLAPSDRDQVMLSAARTRGGKSDFAVEDQINLLGPFTFAKEKCTFRDVLQVGDQS